MVNALFKQRAGSPRLCLDCSRCDAAFSRSMISSMMEFSIFFVTILVVVALPLQNEQKTSFKHGDVIQVN